MDQKQNEEWKEIVGYNGLYLISNYGNIQSNFKRRGFVLLKGGDSSGYKTIVLRNGAGETKKYYIHRLVALYFLDTEEKQTVNHKDGQKRNNYFENLEWSSYSENNAHAYKTKLKLASNMKLTKRKVKNILCLKSLMSQEKIAKKYNVSRGVIANIFNGRSWRDVSGLYGKRY